jgi:hypothetical protein
MEKKIQILVPRSGINIPDYYISESLVGNNFSVLGIRDFYPGSRILNFTHLLSRIPDLGSQIQKQQQKRGVKKNLLS